MSKHLKKISEEVLHTNPWWTYKHEQYEKPSGETGDYYFAETNGVAMIVPMLPDGRIILTLQYRYLFDKQSIEFPAGGIKPDSDPLQTAKEELKEETGWVAEQFTKIATFEPATGYVKDKTHVYLAVAIEQGEQQLDDTEDIEVIYRRPDEIDEMVSRGDIWDGQTLAVWAIARNIFFKEVPDTESPTIKSILQTFFHTDT